MELLVREVSDSDLIFIRLLVLSVPLTSLSNVNHHPHFTLFACVVDLHRTVGNSLYLSSLGVLLQIHDLTCGEAVRLLTGTPVCGWKHTMTQCSNTPLFGIESSDLNILDRQPTAQQLVKKSKFNVN